MSDNSGSLGTININNQKVVGKTDEYTSNHAYGTAWAMHCLNCSHEYAANSCDAHNRKCPKCQNGSSSLSKIN